MSKNPMIYKALSLIMLEAGSIGKTKKNVQQGYMYRGIEDVYLALQKLMAKHGVVCIPTNVRDIIVAERQSRNGGALSYITGTFEYTFYAEDGSSVTANTLGKGMDSGDKDANKAMSVAHKYALLQVFMIPTEDLVDPEVDSPQPKALPKPSARERCITAIKNAKSAQQLELIREFVYRDDDQGLIALYEKKVEEFI